MRIKSTESLESLIRRYQIALLLILTAAAGLGGLWASFWQASYQSSQRLNGLLVEAQAVRGDLYRQIKSVETPRGSVRASQPSEDYWQRLYRIDEHFFRMRGYANSANEHATIARMEAAYGLILGAMNSVVIRPGGTDVTVDHGDTADFEQAYNQLIAQVASERGRLSQRLAWWSRLAPWLAWLPLVFGVVLVLWLNRRFARGFLQPLQRLAAGTGELARGDLSYRLEEGGVSELRHLARTVNSMATELDSKRRALVERERQAALGELVPVIAHNIRNPLAGIRANAQLLDAEASSNEILETGEDIMDAADRLERWLDALLTYLHPLNITREELTLDSVIDGAVAALGGRLAMAEVTLKRQRSDAIIHADAPLLEQALHGLIANALEASPPGGSIRVASVRDKAGAQLTIDDDGPGMAALPDLGGALPLASSKRRGTGLGIPFAYKIIHAHSGTLSYGRAPSGGARTIVQLPQHNNEQ